MIVFINLCSLCLGNEKGIPAYLKPVSFRFQSNFNSGNIPESNVEASESEIASGKLYINPFTRDNWESDSGATVKPGIEVGLTRENCCGGSE